MAVRVQLPSLATRELVSLTPWRVKAEIFANLLDTFEQPTRRHVW